MCLVHCFLSLIISRLSKVLSHVNTSKPLRESNYRNTFPNHLRSPPAWRSWMHPATSVTGNSNGNNSLRSWTEHRVSFTLCAWETRPDCSYRGTIAKSNTGFLWADRQKLRLSVSLCGNTSKCTHLKEAKWGRRWNRIKRSQASRILPSSHQRRQSTSCRRWRSRGKVRTRHDTFWC